MEMNKPDFSKLFASAKDDMIQTDFATLFIIPREQDLSIPVPAELQKVIGHDKVPVSGVESEENDFVLYYTDFDHDGSELHEILQTLRVDSNEDSDLTTRIMSPGGSVMEGMQLIALTKEQFNGRHTTVLEAAAASMGAVLFASGDTRVCYEHSSFMLHDYQSMTYGSGGNNLRQAEHYNDFIDDFFRSIFVANGFLTEGEFQVLKSGTEVYYRTPELVLRGIATHVIVEDTLLDADEYLSYYDSGLTFKEYSEIREELDYAESPDPTELSEEDIAAMIKSGQIEVRFE